MPSIPQSLLWISLVVLWLFVLVPMLISKRDAVRRTSDVALATRVLNSENSGRRLKRGGPASGHRSDPDWRPSEDALDDELDEDADYEDAEDEDDVAPQRSVVVAAAVIEDTDPDYLDVDVIDEASAALPVGQSDAGEAEADDEFEETGELTLDLEDPEEPEENLDTAVYEVENDEYEDRPAGTADGYEYVDDSSGLEAADEGNLRVAESLTAARRRRYDSTKAAAVSARKYKFRKRMLALMTLILVASAATAYFVEPLAWWVCGSFGAVTLMYLGYLRRQTRIEERVRRRRLQRMARSRLGVENTDDREFDLVPSRLRRPGAVVLEIDDEDPEFEHLDYAPSARHYDLPRAAGQ